MSRFQFVADNSDHFAGRGGVKRLCQLVEIERSSYYAWLDGTGLDGTGAGRSERVPGRVNHKRVARIMREHGIRGYQRRRRVRTTIPEPSGQKVPDLLKRDFTAEAPNERYVGDITYLPLADGTNLYPLRDHPVAQSVGREENDPGSLGQTRAHRPRPQPSLELVPVALTQHQGRSRSISHALLSRNHSVQKLTTRATSEESRAGPVRPSDDQFAACHSLELILEISRAPH